MQQHDRFKDAVVYQVYTRSFYDANGDGVGDFKGVIQKLDYLSDLGVDMLWLSPFCASPNKDNGYDISDYRAVMKEFGTMQDLDLLIDECRKRDICIMMDLVLNHTSIEHPWFIESRSSVDNPKRDFYIWAKGKDGGVPNNWGSYFTGNAWTYDERTDEYYLHQFYEEQPDLNWRNEELQHEIVDMIRWWQAKGINAFRLDAIHHIGKPEGLPDAPEPEKPWYIRKLCNTKETHDLLAMMNREIFSSADSVTVGETGGADFETARKYVNRSRHELDLIFHFGHLYPREMTAASLSRFYSEWYSALSPEGWDAVFFGNHDFGRHISVFGNDTVFRDQCAKAFAVMLLTLWGTPFIYQGEELGMTNVRFDSLDDYPDESAKRMIESGSAMGMTREESLEYFYTRTRDNARTPMQWTSGRTAGFTEGSPWIKVNPKLFYYKC